MSKVAVVTGASTGIGRASALALLKAGYRVALVARRQADLEETAQMAGADSNPLENLESLAAVWRDLIAEISPPPTPRTST
jgi:NADP-dependent 3-hydroxy acid dehydrogenase YdfG